MNNFSDSGSIAYQGLDTISMVIIANYGSSKQSSHPTHSSNEQFFQPHYHYANYRPDLYAHRMTTDDDDFEPPRHSTWY